MIEQRKKLRLPKYDYNANGAYFITICTHKNKNLFGNITNGEMKLNIYGEFVKKHIEKIDELYDGVNVDKFVIMPNHLHLLLILGRERIVCVPHDDRSKELLPKII